jgi:PKD repeat protein
MRTAERTLFFHFRVNWTAFLKVAFPGLLFACALLSLPARAEDCTVQCQVVLPTPNYVTNGHYVQFEGNKTQQGNCCTVTADWDFGDGNHAGQWTSDHYYAQPGIYNWTLSVWDSCYSQAPRCQKSGTVTVLPSTCQITCSGAVTSVDHTSFTAQFQATASSSGCDMGGPYPIYYYWSWGDGPDSGWSASPSASHTYPGPGTYYWHLDTRLGSPTSAVYCNATGTVKVGCEGIQVGLLKICADRMVKSDILEEYTFSGNVRINETLWCTGDMVFLRDPNSGTDTLSTNGNVFVKLAGRGDTNVLTGPVSFTVNGAAAEITPVPDALNTFFSFTLQGVSLYQKDLPWQFRTAGLALKPWVDIGNQVTNFHLGWVEMELVLPPGGQIQLSSSRMVIGNLQDYYTLSDPRLAYDATADELDGPVKVNMPPLGSWTLETQLSAFGNCMDRGYRLDPLPASLIFNTGGLNLEQGTLALENICSGTDQTPKFKAVLGGVFLGGENYPAFSVRAAESVYEPINVEYSWLRFRSGSFYINGSPVILNSGNLATGRLHRKWNFKDGGGTLWVDPLFAGKVSNLGFFASNSPGSQPLGYFRGNYQGRIGIPKDFECDYQCPELKALIQTLSGGSFPYYLSGKALRLMGEVTYLSGSPYFEGTVGIAGFPIHMRAQTDDSVPPKWHLRILFGGHLIPPVPLPRAAAETAVERSFTLASQKEWGTFSVTGQTALPAIYLKTPSGQTVTPSTVGNFPGIRYFSSVEENSAFFLVQSCPSGTWVLGEDNLPEPEATFQALEAAPAPQMEFTEVTQSGDSVSIRASFTPATPDAKVNLFYATSTEGAPAGVIAADLPAASGTVQVSWDTTEVPTGSYYLMAEGDDGSNPTITTVHPEPVPVSHGGLQPPSGLAGTFASGIATLSWTPTPTPSVSGYLVRYSDDPSVIGYTSETVASGANGTMIEELDPALNYRFAVVAYDALGNRSAESNSWATAVCAVSAFPEAPTAAGIGQAVDFTAGASSVYCAAGLAYDWNFGDGSAHSALADPTHSYAATGTFTWTLTVSSGGASSISSGDIYISEHSVCSFACSASVPASGKTGESVPFSATGTENWCMGEVAYSWDFGDGTPNGTTAAEAHKYAIAGTYAWTLNASIGGNACTRTGTLTVIPGIPGDCDGDGQVSIGEVQKAINMFLGTLAPGCGVDCNGNGTVSIGEVQKVINAFLGLTATC